MNRKSSGSFIFLIMPVILVLTSLIAAWVPERPKKTACNAAQQIRVPEAMEKCPALAIRINLS